MKSITIFLISTIVVYCHGGDIIDYRLKFWPWPGSDGKECTEPGLFCESCTSLVRCIKNGYKWEKVHVDTCTGSNKCVIDACSDEPDPFCDGTSNLKFVCNSVGIFPDPFYCNKFVMCTKNILGGFEAYHGECDPNTQYNIETGLCNIPLENNRCDSDITGIYPVPLCRTPADNGPLVNRESVYYVCKEYDGWHPNIYYPFLYTCPGTKVYETDLGCQ